MGRYRLDPAEKKIKGTYRKDRELKAPVNMEVLNQAPEPPEDLPEYAKEVWRITAKELQEQQILTLVDMPLFRTYCYCLYMMKEAQHKLDTEGFTVKITNTKRESYEVKSPYISILNEATTQANRLGAAFGLSPLSRQKLNHIKPTNPYSEIDNYMNGWDSI